MSAASPTSGAAGPGGAVLVLQASAGSPWLSFMDRLKTGLGPDVYQSWFARLGFEGIADGILIVSQPTKFLCAWIKQHHQTAVMAAARAIWPEVSSVRITMRGTVRPPPAGAERPAPLVPVERPLARFPERPDLAPSQPGRRSPFPSGPSVPPGRPLEHPRPLAGARIDPKFALTNFITDHANRLAHAAAVHLAGVPGEAHRGYSVLFVHGAPGRGKTHLLQGMAAQAQSFALYLNAQRLCDIYGEACDRRAAASVSSFLQSGLDGRELVLIDDLDLITSARVRDFATQLIRFVLETGRGLIVSAAVAPAAIDGWERALVSRLSGGLVCGMGPMAPSARVSMALAMQRDAVQEGGAVLSDAVTTALGQALGQDGHLLRGGLTKARALQASLDRELTAAEALAAVADVKIGKSARAPAIDAIIDAVALFYNVTRGDIRSARRTANVVRPRHVAMYLAKVLTLRSLPDIGQRFGNRDHTTVLHAARKIERLGKTDVALAQDLEMLRLRLGDGA